MSISIKRQELRQYQTAELSPRLPGWMDLGDCGLVRREGFAIQFLSLYRFSHWKGFRVYYGLQLTIVAAEHLHPTGTLRWRVPQWSAVPWLGNRWRELWIEWEERSQWSERIVAAAHDQVEPSISAPLTLERVAEVFARRSADTPSDLYINWSSAMAHALLGRRDEARTTLIDLRRRLTVWLEQTLRDAPERVAPHHHESCRRLDSAIEALASADAFAQYCRQVSTATEQAIGIPPSQSSS